MVHYIAKAFASTGEYDAVFYGHDHTQARKTLGKTLLCNPGALWSRKNNNIEFAIYDTKINDVEMINTR